jgi:hypothetical protein
MDITFDDLIPQDRRDEVPGIKTPNPAPGVNFDDLVPAAPAAPEESAGILRGIDDAVRGIADVATFGFADEIAAKVGDLTGIGGERGQYEANLEAQRTRDAEGGWPRVAGQVAGAFAVPAGAARSVPGAILQGGAMGGAYGFGSGEGGFESRRDNAALGAAVGGAAGGAVRGAINKLQTGAAKAAVPTNEQLEKAATAAFNKAEAAGVVIRPEGMARLAQDVTQEIAEFGYDPALQPGVKAILDRLGDAAQNNVTLKGMDIIRRVAGNVAKIRDNPSQQAIASRVIEKIDNFVDTLPDEEVLVGNARHGAQALREARELWGRYRRSQQVDTAASRAELRAASTGSGGNADNATRQNVRRMVENPRGMNAAEREAAERVVRGTRGQNALRTVGKLAPTGNGLMTALGVGGAMVNPVLGVPALTGIAAKTLADRGTQRNVERLSELIRSGGQTAPQIAAAARRGEVTIPRIEQLEQIGQGTAMPLSSLAAILATQGY